MDRKALFYLPTASSPDAWYLAEVFPEVLGNLFPAIEANPLGPAGNAVGLIRHRPARQCITDPATRIRSPVQAEWPKIVRATTRPGGTRNVFQIANELTPDNSGTEGNPSARKDGPQFS